MKRQRPSRVFVLALLFCLAALALTGCGPSSSVANQQSRAPVHGDLIVAAAPAAKTNAPAAPANPPPVAAAPTSTAPAAPEYASVGFDKLASYNFEVDDTPFTNTVAADTANNQIPARVKALDDKKVSIKGFMLPLKVSDGVVTEFLIMKDQSMCCYGTVPKINEWVDVKAPGHHIKPIMDQPVSICGTLHVGAMRENGYLIGIYQMEGDKLIGPGN